MAEILDVTDMLPRKWEPGRRRFRWTVAVDGIDAFLVKKPPIFSGGDVQLNPTASYSLDEILIAMGIMKSSVELEVYNPIAPTAAQRFLNWIRGKEENCSKDDLIEQLELKMMDPVGSVVKIIQLDGVDILSYSWGDLEEEDMSVKISYDTMTETI